MVAEAVTYARTSDPILQVRDLRKDFTVHRSVLPWAPKRVLHAVDGVSFDLRPGTVTALVGESGSGKSTVARLIAQLYVPTSGTISFRGQELPRVQDRRSLLAYRSEIQMIFQDPFASLNPVKTIRHHIARPLQIHHLVPRGGIARRVNELLRSVGLSPPEEFAGKYPHQLSGGQRQRVSIARALAVEPQVLLADEPISMLDVSIRMGILNLMLELKDQRQIAFLYITHDIASARYVADDILVMYAGQVVEQGRTDAVLHSPLHPYTRLLLSSVPNPTAGLSRPPRVGRGQARALGDPRYRCRFAERCAEAVSKSICSPPALLEVEPDHWARCHLYPQSSGSEN